MVFSAVAFIAPNYRDFKTYWLKAYDPGTTTPKVMALDTTGAVQVAKLQLNADGFIVSAGQALVIPHINGTYDLWLFPTEAEADANDTSNATRVADDITGVSKSSITADIINDLSQAYEFATDNVYDIIISEGTGNEEKLTKVEVVEAISTINDLSQAYEFATVAAYKAFATEFPVGKTIYLQDRQVNFLVISGTATDDIFGIIASSNVPQSITIILSDTMPLKNFGGISSAGEDLVNSATNSAALQYAVNLFSGPINSTGGDPLTNDSKSGNITLSGEQWTFDDVDLSARWGWSLDCGNAKIFFNGVWELSGCAFFDLHLGYCEPTVAITKILLLVDVGVIVITKPVFT